MTANFRLPDFAAVFFVTVFFGAAFFATVFFATVFFEAAFFAAVAMCFSRIASRKASTGGDARAIRCVGTGSIG